MAVGWRVLVQVKRAEGSYAHRRNLLEAAMVFDEVDRFPDRFIGTGCGDGPLQCRDGIWYSADLETGEAEIVLDGGIERFEQRAIRNARRRRSCRASRMP